MTFAKFTSAVAVATIAIGTATASFAGGTVISAISKSTQAVPVPPVPPAILAIFGPNAALAVGTVGVPGVIVGTVVIAGVVFAVVVPSSSTVS